MKLIPAANSATFITRATNLTTKRAFTSVFSRTSYTGTQIHRYRAWVDVSFMATVPSKGAGHGSMLHFWQQCRVSYNPPMWQASQVMIHDSRLHLYPPSLPPLPLSCPDFRGMLRVKLPCFHLLLSFLPYFAAGSTPDSFTTWSSLPPREPWP